MLKDTYAEVMELWEVPEEFYEAAKPMYRDYEAALAMKMGKKVCSGTQICQWIMEEGLKNPEELLFESYQRNVLKKSELPSGEMGYVTTTFYDRYPFFAQYEPEEYAKYSQEMVDRLNQWDLEVYFGYVKDTVLAVAAGEDVPMHQSQFLTLEESWEMMDKLGGDEFIVFPCNCKAMGRCTEKPINVCIGKVERDKVNTPYDRKLGKVVTRAEIKDVLTMTDKKGLMHSGEYDGLCSCDGKYCYPIKVAKTLGTRLNYPKSHYETQWDEEKCIHCGKCTKICNFGAFTKDENKKVSFDIDKCWGCTICASNCPKGAITLKKRADIED